MIGVRLAGRPLRGRGIDPRNPLARRLVGCWALNEAAGPPVEALSGARAASNTLAWTAAAPGRGLTLAGSGAQYFTMPAPSGCPLDVTGPALSYGGWLWSNSTSTYQTILAKQDAAVQENRQYGVFTVAGTQGQIYVQINGAAGLGPHAANRSVAVTTPWVLGNWNLILVTYDGANARVYVNGQLGATLAAAGSVASLAGTPIFVGYDPAFSGTGGNALIGSVDLPMVWARVLSAAEVASLYADPWQVFAPTYEWPALLGPCAWTSGDQIESNALG